MSTNYKKKRHKWLLDNTCEVCGLERKPSALTKDLRGFGSYLYSYKVAGNWVNNCPSCEVKND